VEVPIDPLRTEPAYTITQAARLARTKPHNVRNWLYGSNRQGRKMRPVFGEKHREQGVFKVSFLELAELIVVSHYRNGSGATIPLNRLRAAHSYARMKMGIPYPFASGQFKVAGGHIIHEFEGEFPGRTIAIDVDGNFVLPMEFDDALSLFDFDATTEELAQRWYPAGRSAPIVVEPGYGAGWPVIDGRNVRASVLLERWRGGMDIESIADDYQLEPRIVEAAIKVGDVAAA
jgi:uncharacterized protein (DUF433 family)